MTHFLAGFAGSHIHLGFYVPFGYALLLGFICYRFLLGF